MFCSDSYVYDVKTFCWFVMNEDQPDAALDTFMVLLIPVTNNKHAPIKKLTVKTVKSHWIDEELKNGMVEREEEKGMANTSGCTTDWHTYYKLRNRVTKRNKNKNILYYKTKINDLKNDDSKKLWSTLNTFLGKKRHTQLHHSLTQMSHSSQNPLVLPTTLNKI